jgi:hypothetical protein
MAATLCGRGCGCRLAEQPLAAMVSYYVCVCQGAGWGGSEGMDWGLSLTMLAPGWLAGCILKI